MHKNENRPGYKKTKVGWIPEDWKCTRLKDCSTKIGSGVTPRGGEEVYLPEGIPLIRSQNVLDGTFCADGLKFISAEQHEIMKGSALQPNDILFNITGASIGRCCIRPEHYLNANVNQHVCIVRLRSDCHTKLFACILNSSIAKRQLHENEAGGGREGLNFQNLGRFRVPLPSLPEQQAIAGVLECWDTAIRNYEKKIEKKRNIKKWLMQRLLTDRQRLPGFAGKWKEVRLGKVTKVNQESLAINTPSDTQFYYLDLSCVDKGRITYPHEKISFEHSPSRARRIFKKHDVLMATVRPNLLGHCYVDFDADEMVCSTGFAVISCNADQLDPLFLYAHLFYEKLNTDLRNLLAGSSYPAINASEVANLAIALPAITEQHAIASVLSSADAEIGSLERKLSVLKDQKRFLLNNLGTGTIRLPRFRGN